jgi:F-type H+-transporting ATPase subunit b
MTSLAFFAAEGPNGYFLPSDPREAFWAAMAFFVVVGLLVWKAGPLITGGLADRTAGIERDLEEARQARADAESALTASSADLPDVSAEEARIRAEAKETAAKLKADMVSKAEADATAMVERGRADVAARRRQAQADLAADVAEMTRTAAEAVVMDGLDAGAQSDLIDTYINQVSGTR